MVDVSKFISTPKNEALLISYLDIFGCESTVDKFGPDYNKFNAVAILDATDIKNLGVLEGKNVELSNENGSVVVKVKKSDEKHEGLIFMPASFYSNLLMSPKTNGTGFFDCKKVKVCISKSSKELSNLHDFLKLNN